MCTKDRAPFPPPLQCGPVVNVHVPKDKLTQMHMGFGFVEFKTEDDAQYAIKVRAWG